MPNVTPVAVFSYNRPEHLRLLLETLSSCRRLDECRVTIFCDGAKRREHEGGVIASRSVAREWAARFGARVVERDENLGLAKSIVGGTTELCNEYGRAIVVEDDFALAPDFLDYMLQSLDRYTDCHEVYQVSGYMFPVRFKKGPDAFFLPQTTTWGWATWERAWRYFDWNGEGADEILSSPAEERRFDLDGSYPYSKMLKQRLAGANDSWGILWWWSVFRRMGLCLHPSTSHVWVGGADSSGTNMGNAPGINMISLRRFRSLPGSSAFAYPEEVAPDESSHALVKRFLRYQQKLLAPTLAGRIRRVAKKISCGLTWQTAL